MKALCVFALLLCGVAANGETPGSFSKIENGKYVRIVVRAKEFCDGRVVINRGSSLGVQLLKDSACGPKASAIELDADQVSSLESKRYPYFKKLVRGLAAAALMALGSGIAMATERPAAGIPVIAAGVALVAFGNRDGQRHIIYLAPGVSLRTVIRP